MLARASSCAWNWDCTRSASAAVAGGHCCRRQRLESPAGPQQCDWLARPAGAADEALLGCTADCARGGINLGFTKFELAADIVARRLALARASLPGGKRLANGFEIERILLAQSQTERLAVQIDLRTIENFLPCGIASRAGKRECIGGAKDDHQDFFSFVIEILAGRAHVVGDFETDPVARDILGNVLRDRDSIGAITSESV